MAQFIIDNLKAENTHNRKNYASATHYTDPVSSTDYSFFDRISFQHQNKIIQKDKKATSINNIVVTRKFDTNMYRTKSSPFGTDAGLYSLTFPPYYKIYTIGE